MNQIRIILHHFGFTVRALADVLGTSHVHVLKLRNGWNAVSSKDRRNLDHPLFSEIEESLFGIEAGSSTNPAFQNWLKARFHVVKAKLAEEENNWLLLQKKIISAHKILQHTRNLNAGMETSKDLILDWWQWQRSKAMLVLEQRDPKAEWELEKRQLLLKKELELIQQKLGSE